MKERTIAESKGFGPVRAVRACTGSGVLIPRVLGVRAVEVIMTASLSQDLLLVPELAGADRARGRGRQLNPVSRASLRGQRVRGHQADAAGTPDGQHGT